MSKYIAAAEIKCRCNSPWLYGFLSEFSKICQEHGIKFIGASPEMIDRMGDKVGKVYYD
jgi:acetyl-CoA carboxylase biotin carboxylase subunit